MAFVAQGTTIMCLIVISKHSTSMLLHALHIHYVACSGKMFEQISWNYFLWLNEVQCETFAVETKK